MKTTETVKILINQLNEDLTYLGIDPKPYSIIVRMTAETIIERDRAYEAYLQGGGKQITDAGRSDPTAIRFTVMNNQARSFLHCLHLAPLRDPILEDQVTTSKGGEENA